MNVPEANTPIYWLKGWGYIKGQKSCEHIAMTAKPGGLRAYITPTEWPTLLVTLLFAGFIVVGASYDATDSSSWVTSSVGAAVGSLAITLLLGLLLFVGLRLIYGWLDGRWEKNANKPTSMRQALKRWLLPTTGILLAGWLPWLIIHFPGDVDSDTITQLLQWSGLIQATDHHPWFDTVIFGAFWDLGSTFGSLNLGLFSYLLVQEIFTAITMAAAITYLGRLGLPNIARWAITAAVALLPVFITTPSAMSKDSFAGIFWILFFISYVEVIRTRGEVVRRPWIAVGFLTVITALCLAKRTNIYVFLICALIAIIVANRRVRWRIAAGAVIILLFTKVIWSGLLLPALGVKEPTSADMTTIFVQQTGRAVQLHGDEMPLEERQAIDKMLRWDGLSEAYNPRRSDAVKGRWDSAAGTSTKIDYLQVWAKQLFRYPGTYLSATINNTYEYFAPLTPIQFQRSLVMDRYEEYWLSRSLDGTTMADVQQITDQIYIPAALADARETTNNEISVVEERSLLSSKAFYASWIPFIGLAFAIRQRSRFLVLASLPLFVCLAVLIAGPIALPRYLIPSIYGAVLMVGLLLTPTTITPRINPSTGSHASG